MSKIEVQQIYKAAYIFSRLSILPKLIEDSRNPGTFIFLFDDSPDIRQEINNFINNAELRRFIEGFKYLRSLIYEEKNQKANGRDEF